MNAFFKLYFLTFLLVIVFIPTTVVLGADILKETQDKIQQLIQERLSADRSSNILEGERINNELKRLRDLSRTIKEAQEQGLVFSTESELKSFVEAKKQADEFALFKKYWAELGERLKKANEQVRKLTPLQKLQDSGIQKTIRKAGRYYSYLLEARDLLEAVPKESVKYKYLLQQERIAERNFAQFLRSFRIFEISQFIDDFPKWRDSLSPNVRDWVDGIDELRPVSAKLINVYTKIMPDGSHVEIYYEKTPGDLEPIPDNVVNSPKSNSKIDSHSYPERLEAMRKQTNKAFETAKEIEGGNAQEEIRAIDKQLEYLNKQKEKWYDFLDKAKNEKQETRANKQLRIIENSIDKLNSRRTSLFDDNPVTEEAFRLNKQYDLKRELQKIQQERGVLKSQLENSSKLERLSEPPRVLREGVRPTLPRDSIEAKSPEVTRGKLPETTPIMEFWTKLLESIRKAPKPRL